MHSLELGPLFQHRNVPSTFSTLLSTLSDDGERCMHPFLKGTIEGKDPVEGTRSPSPRLPKPWKGDSTFKTFP